MKVGDEREGKDNGSNCPIQQNYYMADFNCSSQKNLCVSESFGSSNLPNLESSVSLPQFPFSHVSLSSSRIIIIIIVIPSPLNPP